MVKTSVSEHTMGIVVMFLVSVFPLTLMQGDEVGPWS